MLKSIPWDVWAAGVFAVAAVLAMIFEPAPAAFIVAYIFLCAYVVVKAINGTRGGS